MGDIFQKPKRAIAPEAPVLELIDVVTWQACGYMLLNTQQRKD
jgi:hypothetical protein